MELATGRKFPNKIINKLRETLSMRKHNVGDNESTA